MKCVSREMSRSESRKMISVLPLLRTQFWADRIHVNGKSARTKSWVSSHKDRSSSHHRVINDDQLDTNDFQQFKNLWVTGDNNRTNGRKRQNI